MQSDLKILKTERKFLQYCLITDDILYESCMCEMLDIYFIWRQLSFNEKIYFLLGIAIRFARTFKNHDSGVHYD